ncbi:MAG: hypothetical protein J2P25_26490, partial [Nocardiopsaceae bacterium]|nr:hypothetical protein [Nocardiopsaceae bacterium]
MAITAPLPIVTEPEPSTPPEPFDPPDTVGAADTADTADTADVAAQPEAPPPASSVSSAGTPAPPAGLPADDAEPPAVSATLAAGEALDARRKRGERVLPMAFGEAGVPAAPILRYALAAASHKNGYGPVAGAEALREAAAGYWTRRGLPTSPDDVVCGPGSKALLYGLLLSLGSGSRGSGSRGSGLPGAEPGSGTPEVAIAQPSWVSYAAQASLTGVRPVHVPVPAGPGG